MASDISKLLFYWEENGRYTFSRTKFLTVVTFIICLIDGLISFSLPDILIITLILCVPVFVIGFLVHKFANIDSDFYDGNLLYDIKHFLFYWHENNRFRLSKTKIITCIIIIITLLFVFGDLTSGDLEFALIAYAMTALVFAIPVFLIGYAIHRFLTKDDFKEVSKPKGITISEPKLTISKTDIPSKFSAYAETAENLKREFDEKESKTRELISVKFAPPQLSYNRFMDVVEKCSKIFNEQYDAVFNIINFGDDDSTKAENLINSKIGILKSLIDKLEDLSNELVINMSKSNTDDVDGVLNDMSDLISSIDDYDV